MGPLLIYLIILLLTAFSAPWLMSYAYKRAPLFFGLISATGFMLLLSYAKGVAKGKTYGLTFEWLPDLYLNFSLYLDGLSLLFGLLVTGMGALVMVFAGKYMQPYALRNRFFFYILLFEFAMLALVLSGNLFTLFIFWELTSVTSFLLIGFSHEKPEARSAALQGLLITVSGGLAMMAGFIMLGQVVGSLEIAQLLKSGSVVQNHPHYLWILLLILAGAFTKSAQFPFHFWLPGAMQAPSPVSAFLHSATMVKAGIYLLARLSPLLAGTPEWKYILTITGAVTMILGGYFAYSQTDFKKVLAYTTISALGTLVLMLGIHTEISVKAAIIFLLVHALYKGSLFMVAGLIDKSTGSRDLRKLGGLFQVMPITSVAAIVSLLSMAGLPPMIGFIGKELIYEAKFALPEMGNFLLVAGVATNIIMVAISLALIFRLFLGKLRFPGNRPQIPDLALSIGPMILAAISLVIGLFPSQVSNLLLKPAIASVMPEITHVKLALWHGFNEVLVLSLITVIAGLILFRLYSIVNPRLTYFNNEIITFRFADSFNKGLKLFTRLTKKKTAFIQSGYQRYYLMAIFIITSLLAWYQLYYTREAINWWHFQGAEFYDWAIVVIITASAILAAITASRLVAIIALGVTGYGITLVFLIYGAVDVAITMLLVETLILILFLLLIYHLPRFTNFSSTASRLRDAAIALTTGGFMTGLVLKATQVNLHPTISEYFIATAKPLANGENIVNVILVDYRALDTLGEITVLAVAALGVVALLKLKTKKGSTS